MDKVDKIIFFSSSFRPTMGGISTYVYDLIKYTAKNLEQVKVIGFKNKNPRKEKILSNVDVCTYRTVGFWQVGLIIFWKILVNPKIKYLHATNLFPVAFWIVFWGKIFFRKTSINFYGTDTSDSSASSKTVKLKKWTIDNADKVITISHFTKQQSKDALAYKRSLEDIDIVYPGVPDAEDVSEDIVKEEIEKIKSKINFQEDDFLLLTVCYLAKRKGVSLIIDTVKKINNGKIKLLIVGAGPEQENLQRKIKEENLSDRAFMFGRVPYTTPYYRLAQVGILNSFFIKEEGDFEGLGLVLLEAQRLGKPVIGSDSGGIVDAIADSRTGFIVKEKDVDDLADKILEFYNNKDLYKSFSANCKSFLSERFSWDKNIKDFLALIK